MSPIRDRVAAYTRSALPDDPCETPDFCLVKQEKVWLVYHLTGPAWSLLVACGIKGENVDKAVAVDRPAVYALCNAIFDAGMTLA